MGTIVRRLALGALGLVIVMLVGLAVLYVATGPEGPPAGSASAVALEAGAYAIGESDLIFVDDSRATPANGSYPGADSRTLVTTLWYPEEALPGGSPLAIYSHGFMSDRQGGNYLARALARQGYVVAAADFPLTNMNAPGGPNPADVRNQPGDVSFLIDRVLALAGEAKPFPGEIDAARIGVVGLSLGGLTSTLVGYHPRWRDERVRAVISIAGPAAMFTRRFFLTSRAPFLMIAGTADAIVDYEANAAVIPSRVPQGTLLTIRDAAHTSFVSLAEPAMRFMDHPDSLGCDALQQQEEGGTPEDPFSVLGDAADGINTAQTRLTICAHPLGKALHPGRQQMITQLGVVSFFAAQFAQPAEARQAARALLTGSLAADFPEVTVSF